MSEQDRIPSEQELWDLLTDPIEVAAKPEPKAPRPKSGPRFAKEAPVKDVPPVPIRQKPDSYFYACMAAVAAVSVAVTLLLTSLLGGGKTPGPVRKDPVIETTAPAPEEIITDDVSALLAELELENQQLREQVQLQSQQIRDLQAQLLEQGGTTQQPSGPSGSTSMSDPASGTTEQSDQQKAYEIFDQIKAAYTDFDRARLEELIPQMDGLVNYLSSEAMNEYYLILEYVEQPSNG